MPEFPLEAWLARIDWRGSVEPTPETLVTLHRHQLHAIPFENLDPLVGRSVSLKFADLADKLVHCRRGGYCFELNGLFLLALQAIGFHTRSLCARVLISEGTYAARSHQITLVESGSSRWLADFGFGGNGLIEAIPFELECEFDQQLDRFRLIEDPTYGYRLEHYLPTSWRALYAFSLDPYLPSDFQVLNYFTSRASESFFTRIPICVRTTTEERRILLANQFKIRSVNGTDTTVLLETVDQLRACLARHFEITPPDDYELPEPVPLPPGMREI